MTVAEQLPARGHVLQIGMGWFGEEPGGLNRMYAGLMTGLAARDVRATGLVAGDAARCSPPQNVKFFARREASLPARLAACRRATRAALAESDVGVVAAHFAPYALPGLDLFRDRPLVFHFHGPWAAESAAERENSLIVSVKRAVERAVYTRARRFIVLSGAFADLLAKSYGVRDEAVECVPGGVDAARFAITATPHEARSALELPTGRPVIGVVRRLVHRVGLEGLIEAVAAVRARVPDVLVAIGGTGPLGAELAARVSALGVDAHVKFLGFVPDDRLPLLYRACDVTVVPSLTLEGFGLTTIESLATGTPVIVTPVGGLPETVYALDPGLILEDHRPATLAAALGDALTGRRRLPSRERCAAYARENFDWPVIAARVLRVYRSL
jgi:glycosyltransferase involved in cell wall biosynthesis